MISIKTNLGVLYPLVVACLGLTAYAVADSNKAIGRLGSESHLDFNYFSALNTPIHTKSPFGASCEREGEPWFKQKSMCTQGDARSNEVRTLPFSGTQGKGDL